MNKTLYCLVLLVVVGCSSLITNNNGVSLVKDGKSAFSIYYEAPGDHNIRLAAEELQEYIRQTSGVTLPVCHRKTATNMIILGNNALFKEAGLSLQGVTADGARIAVKNGNIYIAGYDKENCQGTLFGTYKFIEDYLGVRWFLPGPEGEYVPHRKTVSIPPVDVIDNPGFKWRRIPYLKKKNPHVKRWCLRNRQNNHKYHLDVQHGHVWEYVFNEKHFDKHPEWFAEMGGVRMRPSGDRFKICTTSKGAINHIANYVIEAFNRNPKLNSFSISPTDSAGWCRCKECVKLDDKNAYQGITNQENLTNRLLTFYTEVAKRVGKVHPDKKLGAYLYTNCLYPPENWKKKIPDNLHLTVASSLTYGYTFYRPEVKKDWYRIINGWSKILPQMGYYDLPKHSAHNGAPLAPCIEILKEMFPAIKKNNVTSVYIYGDPEWGHSVGYNYLLAKLVWNPDLDIDKHMQEFYEKCYGKGAADIEAIYNLIAKEVKKYYLKNGGAYMLTLDMLKTIYAKNFPTIEKYYFTALAKVTDPQVRKRIKMLGDNLTMLYHNFDLMGIKMPTQESRFKLTEQQFAEFIKKVNGKLHVRYVDANATREKLPALTVKPSTSNWPKTPIKRYQLRNSQEVVLYAPNDNVINIKIDNVSIRISMIQYSIYNSRGELITKGTAGTKGKTISFNGCNGEYYFMFLKTASSSFALSMPDIPYCFKSTPESSPDGLHFSGSATPIYFYVPEGDKEFSILLSSASKPGIGKGGETAQATVYSPDGKKVGDMSTVKIKADRFKIEKPAAGWWKVAVGKAPVGCFDDAYIKVDGEGIAPYFSLEPSKLLEVEH